jgi:hypothetical protein
MDRSEVVSLAERIAGLDFAVALLAEIVRIQGLATPGEIDDMMRSTATDRPSAAVARRLAAISRIVGRLEERAITGGRVELHVVKSDEPMVD